MSTYSENYKLIKWSVPATVPETKPAEANGAGPYFVPDIAEFIAPGHVWIGSRSALREYERRHGVRQCGELKTPADFDNTPKPSATHDRALDQAFKVALEKVGL